jgi:Fe-S cluster assembly ATP-binding protein
MTGHPKGQFSKGATYTSNIKQRKTHSNTTENMLSIRNLSVSINGKNILRKFNLEVNEGEIHAIMGPNGTGKSTLAAVIAGREMFDVDEGEILYRGQNLLEMSPEIRAREGIFLGFQYPVEIPGVSMANFMRTAMNEKRKHLGLEPLTGAEFLKIMEEKKNLVDIQSKLTNRSVNEGFSGGEKKKNEIFQMALLEPRLAILDETDSGLDIDALKVVANGVNKLRRKDNATVVITHYQRLLDYIVPDFVHVLFDGRIVKSGGKDLAIELENKGYEWIKKEAGIENAA